MKAKKVLSLLLVGAMAMSILAGCGQEKDTKKESEAQKSSEVSKEEKNEVESETKEETGVTFPLAEPYEVDVVVHGGSTVTYDFTETVVYKYMEEKTNVIFNVTTMSGEEIKEKLGLMFSADNYPEVIIKAAPAMSLESYASEGIIIPLEDLMKEYAPNYCSVIDNHPLGWPAVSQDGHVYSFYDVFEQNASPFGSATFTFINTKWLDDLGMDMPNNAEEYYEALKAFKENDMDGDGDPNNEVPLLITKNVANEYNWLPQFGLNVSGNWSIDDAGSIEYYAVTEEYKEFLAFFAKCYAEGLINEDMFTLDYWDAAARVQNGEMVAGAFASWGVEDMAGVYDSGKAREENLVAQYEALMPFDGMKMTSDAGLYNGALYITDKCERPDIMVAWADLLYNDEYVIKAMYGEEGDTYDIVDGMIKVRNLEETPSATYGTDINGARIFLGGGSNSPLKRYLDDIKPYLDYENQPYNYEVYIKGFAKELQAAGLKHDPFPMYSLGEEAKQENSDILADTNPYRNDYKAKVITGEYDLESTWEDYLATMEEMGIQRATELQNEAYQAYLGN